MIKTMIRETVTCNGIFDRIKREVFNAVVTMPRNAERDERLFYWQARQANAEKMKHIHRLDRPYYMRPIGKLTKIERAMVREDALVPAWRPCPAELALGA